MNLKAVGWGTLIVVAVSALLMFLPALDRYSNAQDSFYRAFDAQSKEAAKSITAGEMSAKLGVWLKNADELGLPKKFDSVKEQVLALQTELLQPSETLGDALVKRERLRVRIAMIPTVSEEAFAVDHSFLLTWTRFTAVFSVILWAIVIAVAYWLSRPEKPIAPRSEMVSYGGGGYSSGGYHGDYAPGSGFSSPPYMGGYHGPRFPY